MSVHIKQNACLKTRQLVFRQAFMMEAYQVLATDIGKAVVLIKRSSNCVNIGYLLIA